MSEYLRKRFGEDAIRAAHDVAAGEDGIDWDLLQRTCPDDLEHDEYFGMLVGAKSV